LKKEMTKTTDRLKEIAEKIRQDFTARDAARENLLPLCREAIRYCSQSIRALHRRQFDVAQKELKIARDTLHKAGKLTSSYSELSNAGFYRDAQKEFTEASITLALVTGKPLPSPEELSVEPAAYLNGLAEAACELRRFLLDSIRRDDLKKVESIMEIMDDIYNTLIIMDFPDAITGGLRRNTDIVRGVLEKTRGDLTLIMRQKSLEDRLSGFDNNT
jgi:translin